MYSGDLTSEEVQSLGVAAGVAAAPPRPPAKQVTVYGTGQIFEIERESEREVEVEVETQVTICGEKRTTSRTIEFKQIEQARLEIPTETPEAMNKQ